MANLKHYIFIDKKRLIAGKKNASKIVGSMKQLLEQDIVLNGTIINYDKLIKLLGKEKYYNDENYYIKRTEIERKKRNNEADRKK